MDLISSARILWRRKWACIAVLALTAVLALVVGTGIKANHTAAGRLVLLPPTSATAAPVTANPQTTTSTDRPNNPYLTATGLGVLAQAVVSVITDAQSVDRIVAAGGLDTFILTADEQGGGSFITAKVTGTDARRVLVTYELLVDAYTRELANQQQLQNVPPQGQIRLQPLVTPIATTKDVGSRVQALLIIGLLGTMAAVGAAFLLESLAEGRERAASGAGDAASGAAGPAPGADAALAPFLEYAEDDPLPSPPRSGGSGAHEPSEPPISAER